MYLIVKRDIFPAMWKILSFLPYEVEMGIFILQESNSDFSE